MEGLIDKSRMNTTENSDKFEKFIKNQREFHLTKDNSYFIDISKCAGYMPIYRPGI